jgi:hypothetical protein
MEEKRTRVKQLGHFNTFKNITQGDWWVGKFKVHHNYINKYLQEHME